MFLTNQSSNPTRKDCFAMLRERWFLALTGKLILSACIAFPLGRAAYDSEDAMNHHPLRGRMRDYLSAQQSLRLPCQAS